MIYQRRRIAIALLGTAVFAGAAWTFLGSKFGNGKLDDRVAALLTSKPNESWAIDLNQIGGGQLTKLCVQPPYMTADQFATHVGHPVDGFSSVGDDVNVLWLFNAREAKKVALQRVSVMDKSATSRDVCGEPSTHELAILGTAPNQTFQIRRK